MMPIKVVIADDHAPLAPPFAAFKTLSSSEKAAR
jgi:hypothetical protein